jgi:hypothetical protein
MGELGIALANMLLTQTRYPRSDLLLAFDRTVFSRFIVTLHKDLGKRIIATSGIGHILGFACRDFMRYDYLLGRANAQRFLKQDFVLHESNPLFDIWPLPLRSQFRVVDPKTNDGYLPIIPLIGTAAVPESMELWPKHKLDFADYGDLIEERFRKIAEYEGSAGLVSGTVAWLLAHFGQRSLTDLVSDTAKNWLNQSGLG